MNDAPHSPAKKGDGDAEAPMRLGANMRVRKPAAPDVTAQALPEHEKSPSAARVAPLIARLDELEGLIQARANAAKAAPEPVKPNDISAQITAEVEKQLTALLPPLIEAAVKSEFERRNKDK